MNYLVVGLDLRTHEPWHLNVHADCVVAARRLAVVRAAARGVTLVVAGVIGPGANVLPEAIERPATSSQAA